MNLTENQLRAVNTTSKQTLVMAGAGSGKTDVLIKRVQHLLIERNVDPYAIMVLTFTRKAAGEMRSRLNEWAEDQGCHEATKMIDRLTLGTFHKVALGFLRTHGGLLDYKTEELGIVGTDDSEALLKQISKDLGYFRNNKWKYNLSFKKVTAYMEAFYNEGEDGTTQKMLASNDASLIIIFREYRSQLKKMNLLDFGSILTETQRLFKEHPKVLDEYKSTYRHVLVDEGQDCDRVQYNLHQQFCPPASLFMCSDPKQSIYGFRGARPDMMTTMYNDAEIIDLQENFRSEAKIVEASNRLITHNNDSLAKPMMPTQTFVNIPSIETICGRSEDIAKKCQSLRMGWGWQDIAVLARTHRVLKYISRTFAENNIPHHRVGSSFDICKTEEFRDIHAALRLCVNHYDELAFLRLYKDLGLSDEMYADIKANAARQGTSSMKYWRELEHHKSSVLCTDIVESYNHELCLVAGYACEFAVYFGSDLHNSASLFWRRNCKHMSIESALNWVAFMDSQDDIKEGDFVTLSTIHAAKGLEYPVVIIADMNEGILPSSQAVNSESEEAMGEERRVCYVAMTRAQDRLILHYRRPEDQHLEGKTKTGKVYEIKPKLPSRFLKESEVMNAIT